MSSHRADSQALQLRLIAGRYLDETDTEGAPPVMVVNQSFAKLLFPKQKPDRATDS